MITQIILTWFGACLFTLLLSRAFEFWLPTFLRFKPFNCFECRTFWISLFLQSLFGTLLTPYYLIVALITSIGLFILIKKQNQFI